MKKILLCLCAFIVAVTLFSQPALAEDATYDSETGTLTIPAAIVGGSTCYIDVSMQLEIGAGLTFTVAGATPQPCNSDTSGYTTSDTSGYTTYDSTTGIAHIPNVVVDGNTCYTADMQQQDELTFTVIGATPQECMDNRDNYTLNVRAYGVTRDPVATGLVISSPLGINCTNREPTGTCEAVFAAGTVVTLTATPDSGFFAGPWFGEDVCDEMGGDSSQMYCRVIMNSDKQIIGTFDSILPPY